MKKCPYCAEEIQDDAIKCRWCQSWLVEEVPAGADTPRTAPAASEASASSSSPAAATSEAASAPMASTMSSTPAQTSPSTFQTAPAQATPAQSTPAQSSPAQAAAQSTPAAAPAETKTEFTHTGSRFLLGYGGDFFGIWDRNAPQQPIERFPRNDQGWASAWARYASIETNWMDLRTGQKSG